MAFKDTANTTDLVTAGIDSEAKVSEFPCPKCGRATKEAQEPGMRVCSSRSCRHVVKANEINTALS